MTSYSWPPDGPYEYRALERFRHDDGTWSKWTRIGNRLAYPTIAACRSFVTRQKNEYKNRMERWGPRNEREWKIQRRPVDMWEDFE